MKQILIILSYTILTGCSNPKAFVLNDTAENKYFVSGSIQNAFEKDQIGQSPLIVINGIPFRYNNSKTQFYFL